MVGTCFLARTFSSKDSLLAAAHSLLQAAVAHVAHYQIRNSGTVGGSLSHADPAAELPGLAVTWEGEG